MIGLLAVFLGGGCASLPAVQEGPCVATMLSPVAEPASPREALRLAEAYEAEHPGCETMMGTGDSMLPLYRDQTVLVVQPVAFADLRRSMTVVFVGDRGRPVAHVLTEKTPRGWRAIGLGNGEPDLTMVRYANLVGVVVKAYALTNGKPLLTAAMPAPIPAAAGHVELVSLGSGG